MPTGRPQQTALANTGAVFWAVSMKSAKFSASQNVTILTEAKALPTHNVICQRVSRTALYKGQIKIWRHAVP